MIQFIAYFVNVRIAAIGLSFSTSMMRSVLFQELAMSIRKEEVTGHEVTLWCLITLCVCVCICVWVCVELDGRMDSEKTAAVET